MGTIFFTGLLLRVIYTWTHGGQFGGAFALYDSVSWNLAQGLGFSYDGQGPFYYPAPLYPLLVSVVYSIVGHSPQAAVWLQTVADSLGLFLVYLVARQFFDWREAALAMGLVACYPAFWTYASQLRLESTLQLGVLLFTYLLGKAWKSERLADWALAGCGLGVLTLLKAVGLVLPLFVAIGYLSRVRTQFWTVAMRLGMLCLVLAAIVLPWTVRNWIQSGHLIPVSTGAGQALWLGTHLPYEGCWPTPGHDLSEFARAAGGLGNEYQFTIENDRKLLKQGLRNMAENPGATAWMFAKKAVYFWTGNRVHLLGPEGDLKTYWREDVAQRGFVTAVYSVLRRFVILPLLLLLACYGLWSQRTRWRDLWPLLVCPICWTLVHSVLVVESGRFNIPVLPLVFILSAYGAFHLGGLFTFGGAGGKER